MTKTRFIGGPFDGLEEDRDYAGANWVFMVHNGREYTYKKHMVTTIVAASGTSHSAAYRFESVK